MASDDDVRQQLAELFGPVSCLSETEVRNLSGGTAFRLCTDRASHTRSLFLKARDDEPRDAASLESRIGAQLLNRIGIVAVLVAWPGF